MWNFFGIYHDVDFFGLLIVPFPNVVLESKTRIFFVFSNTNTCCAMTDYAIMAHDYTQFDNFTFALFVSKNSIIANCCLLFMFILYTW